MKILSRPQPSPRQNDFTIQLYPCLCIDPLLLMLRMFYSLHIKLIFQMKNFLLIASLLATLAFADLDLANNLRGTDNVVIEGCKNSGEGNRNTFRGDRNYVNGDENRFVGNRNNVDGDENDIEGNQNELDGNGNKVIGTGNFVSGSGNFVIGTGNQVNTMPEAEQRKIAEQITAKIRERLQMQRFAF